MFGVINQIMYDDFTVLNSSGVRVSGIGTGAFTKTLYNPSGSEVSGSITVSITELGGGDYRLSYTPNVKGLWKVNIFHAIYFPAGKTNSYQIYNVDIDSVYIDLETIDGKANALITSTGHISAVVDEILSGGSINPQDIRDAMKLAASTGSPEAGSIDAKINLIPTNPMLSNTTGSTFSAIPNMAKQTTLLSVYTSTGDVLTAGFLAGAKQATLLEVQTSTGHISQVVDTFSSTGVVISPQSIRDALKLTPSAGIPSTNSIDAKLNEILIGQEDNSSIINKSYSSDIEFSYSGGSEVTLWSVQNDISGQITDVVSGVDISNVYLHVDDITKAGVFRLYHKISGGSFVLYDQFDYDPATDLTVVLIKLNMSLKITEDLKVTYEAVAESAPITLSSHCTYIWLGFTEKLDRLTITVTAAEYLAAFKVVTFTGEIADSNNISQYGEVAGIILTATSTGTIGRVVTEGEIISSTWAWAPGDTLYLNGTSLSTTPPTSGFNVVVAEAMEATKVYVDISESVLL